MHSHLDIILIACANAKLHSGHRSACLFLCQHEVHGNYNLFHRYCMSTVTCVDFQVCFKLICPSKALFALNTFIRLLSGVGTKMTTQIFGFYKSPVTDFTFVTFFWLCPMRPFMSFAFAGLSEAFATDGAGERPLPSVHMFMSHKFVEFTKCLAAERTLMRCLWFLKMSFPVPLQF